MYLLKKKRIPFKKLITFGLLPSKLKIILLKLAGHSIGKCVEIRFGSVIIGDKITIHNYVKISPFTIIIAKEIFIGENSIIGSFCFIDTLEMKIGNNVRFRELVKVGGNKSIGSALNIGNDCLILQDTLLNTTD
tara:strand:+ start:3571 stop:3972 length:402 start_codon:yes stop_codon:yes gene_type:complete